MTSTLDQTQVPNETGPGVLRSKRPLLTSRIRYNVLWKPPEFGNKFQFGNKVTNRLNVWSIEGVTVYGHVLECRVTFGIRILNNILWIKTSSKWIKQHLHKWSYINEFQRVFLIHILRPNMNVLCISANFFLDTYRVRCPANKLVYKFLTFNVVLKFRHLLL